MRFGVRPIRGLKNATLWVSTVSASDLYQRKKARSNTAGPPFGCLASARMHDERPFDEFGKRLAAVNDL